jgi:hypothetical protein
MTGAGMTGAGGEALKSVPAAFELSEHETVTVITAAEFAAFTTVSKINDCMFAFYAPSGSRSLLLTLN